MVTKLSKIWVGDPGTGENLSRIQGLKRHRISNTGTILLDSSYLYSGHGAAVPSQYLGVQVPAHSHNSQDHQHKHDFLHYCYQCSESGSGSTGSTCFWEPRIRIH
jgi:hypothetical protein